jgi:hypothetical protein
VTTDVRVGPVYRAGRSHPHEPTSPLPSRPVLEAYDLMLRGYDLPDLGQLLDRPAWMADAFVP